MATYREPPPRSILEAAYQGLPEGDPTLPMSVAIRTIRDAIYDLRTGHDPVQRLGSNEMDIRRQLLARHLGTSGEVSAIETSRGTCYSLTAAGRLKEEALRTTGMQLRSPSGMTHQEIMRLVNRFIGVSGGYLGDFSYRTHAEFYPEFCNLDVDPNNYQGTTRERFITILSSIEPADQAKVIRGVVDRFPVGNGPSTRTIVYRAELLALARRLEAGEHVAATLQAVTSEVVRRAIADADSLVATEGPISAVDRIHTALHGYILSVCDAASISYPADVSLTAAFKLVRTQHPKFAGPTAQSKEIERIAQACATIADAMNPVRNQASVAHPNRTLLGDAEAHLVIDVGRSIINYLDAKVNS
jgi:hypothetical protein